MAATDRPSGALTITGRIDAASNATFLGAIGDTAVVYKPRAGESPLWDFPRGTLADREVAAYLVSQALGWGVVPHTWLEEGPFGEGMVQLWQEQDGEQVAVDVVPSGRAPESGWKHVLEGEDVSGEPVTLVHEDTPALRRMAVFDVLVNNADRKGGHILAMPDGHRYGVDHGLTFHSDPKLRTILWGWLGEPLSADEIEGIDRVSEGLDGDLGRAMADLLSNQEIAAFAARCTGLRAAGRFPSPTGETSPVPWPLF